MGLVAQFLVRYRFILQIGFRKRVLLEYPLATHAFQTMGTLSMAAALFLQVQLLLAEIVGEKVFSKHM